eukprot:Skav236433  [mRNA]  locus=scaffold1156:303753:312123:- [translate_table: standard]
MLGAVLAEVELPDVASSGWPVLRLLGHVSRVVRRVEGWGGMEEGWTSRGHHGEERRHGFQLDFLPSELLGADDAQLSSESMSLDLRDVCDCLPSVVAAAERTAQRWNGLRLVYATMAYGQRFTPYISRFLGRATALSVTFVTFCLDDAAYDACVAVKGLCVRGTPSILNKNLDVFWLDLDVFLFQSPTPSLAMHLRQQPTAELLVSGAFAAAWRSTGGLGGG